MSRFNIREKIFKKIRNKYRLIIYNDNSLKEVLSLRLTKLNVIMLIGVMTILWIFFVYYVVALTPLKSYLIPDFPKANERKGIVENALKVDSLEARLMMYENYVEKVKAVLRGEDVAGYNIYDKDSAIPKQNIDLSITKDDSILRKQVEAEEEFNISTTDDDKNTDAISGLILFAPVKGIITNSYSPIKSHYGTDIVTTKDQVVHAAMNGTVIISQWTLETGYVLCIQHEKDLVTEYKHCAKILKKVGDRILSGESIGIVGNTGELSTGPHLHFELWHKGTALNPEQYINFK